MSYRNPGPPTTPVPPPPSTYPKGAGGAPGAPAGPDLTSLTVAELRTLARDREVEGWSRLSKAELLAELS
jgi:hypothetical protein